MSADWSAYVIFVGGGAFAFRLFLRLLACLLAFCFLMRLFSFCPALFCFVCSVLLPRLLCSLLGAFRGRGEVVNRLVLLPSTELVSDLYAVLRCCHGGNGEKEQG